MKKIENATFSLNRNWMMSVVYFNSVWKSYRQPACNMSKTSGKTAKKNRKWNHM